MTPALLEALHDTFKEWLEGSSVRKAHARWPEARPRTVVPRNLNRLHAAGLVEPEGSANFWWTLTPEGVEFCKVAWPLEYHTRRALPQPAGA